MADIQIWRVIVSDGTAHYFTAEAEAEFFAKDTVEAGFTATTAPIPLPKDARSFVWFMERMEQDRRHAELLLKQIETVTPNWQAFRSLAEAVEVNINLPKP